MYAVVGCTECGSYWLLSDPEESETATCPRCGRRHQTRKLRRFYRSDDRDAARQARAALLAEKQGQSEAFSDLPSVTELEHDAEDAGIDDGEYLEKSGLDADEVAAAGDVSRRSTPSRDEVVRAALREQDSPDESAVVAYAEERGVPAEAARDLLERLTRRGEVSESGGRYRLL
jgi:predicted  nucleic acid-binding Zn-ribbon protein